MKPATHKATNTLDWSMKHPPHRREVTWFSHKVCTKTAAGRCQRHANNNTIVAANVVETEIWIWK